MNKWYKNVYRRHLMDMHVNDDKNWLLSKLDAQAYYDNLVKAKIQSPMIYLQSHTGLCNFPTKSGKMHSALVADNKIKRLVDLCKSGGMKVVGYYSLIFNNWATDNHPEWEQVCHDGKTWRELGQRYGLCCPNNDQYLQFVREQIQELALCYPNLDGIFYDMPYWEIVCHCPACQERWSKEVGGVMPTEQNWQDVAWRTLVKKRQQWMAEFVAKVKQISLEIMPDTTVEFNFAAVIGCDWLGGSTEAINDSNEFCGGDLYGDLYSHSFTCKYYYGITKNQPFEYMTCRCNRNLREHTVTKPRQMMLEEVLLTVAHHGASLIIDAIDPVGTMDERVYDRLGDVFESQMPYEKYLDRGKMYGEVAIYFDSTAQFLPDDNSVDHKKAVVNALQALVENHVATAIISNGSMQDLSQYQVIVAPVLYPFENDQRLQLIDYVAKGGTLYLSGESDPRLLAEFFGGKIIGKTFGESRFSHVYKGYQEVQAYLCPLDDYCVLFGDFNASYPMPLTYKLPIMENYKGDVKGVVVLPATDPDDNGDYVSIHSNPPHIATQIPALLQTKYGKGKVIWSCAVIERDERANFKQVFANIVLANVNKKYDISVGKSVECVIFHDDNAALVSFVDLAYDSAKPVQVAKMAFASKPPQKVWDITHQKQIDFCYANGICSLSIDVADFTMIIIEY